MRLYRCVVVCVSVTASVLMCVYVRRCVCVDVWVCVSFYVYVDMCVGGVSMNSYTYLYICLYIYIYINPYIYMYMFTRTLEKYNKLKRKFLYSKAWMLQHQNGILFTFRFKWNTKE